MAVSETKVRGLAFTGNEAVAQAMKQINPDVVAAYPITPQTEIVQIFSTFVADGLVKTEFVTVESEHSAMSATVGASAAGARAMTATSSQGLAYMWEVLYIAAGMRLPIVMPVVNRALSAPINIHGDHSDTMGARDSGWIQLYAENAQEAYDNLLQAVRIAEHPEVLLPTMSMMDGFIISHALENVQFLDDETVRKFIGEYKPEHYLLDVDHPITMGAFDMYDYYFEHKRQQAEAMKKAKGIVAQVGAEYGKISGRNYGFFETYQLDDAEVAIVAIGSTAGTAKAVIKVLRKEGVKAGLLKVRMFRPFPREEMAAALKDVKAIAVLDRAESLSTAGGPLFVEVRSALYDLPARPLISNYIYGLGGRDMDLAMIRHVYDELGAAVKAQRVKELVQYLGVRE